MNLCLCRHILQNWESLNGKPLIKSNIRTISALNDLSEMRKMPVEEIHDDTL